MTDFTVRALVAAPHTCAALVAEVVSEMEKAGIRTRTVEREEAILPALEEYRFDTAVFFCDTPSPPVALQSSSIPRHLQIPTLLVSIGEPVPGRPPADLRIDSAADWPRIENLVRTVAARGRAAFEGGTPEKALADSVGAILWRADPITFDFSYVSDEAETILGYPVSDWLADPNFWVQLIHEEDREITVQTCVDATARGEDHEFEYRMVARDGRVVWVRDIVRLVDIEGRIELVGVMIDITEAKQVEMALRESEKRFRQVTEAIEEVFWLRDRDRAFYVSPAYEKIWGRAADELYSDASTWDRSIHPDDRALLTPVLGKPPSAVRELTFRIVRPDGEVRWIHNRSFPVRDDQGQTFRMAGIARDISDLVSANEKLVEREAHYQRLVTHSPEMVNVLELDGTIREINSAGARILGQEPGDMIGRSFLDFLIPADIASVRTSFADLVDGVNDRFDADIRFSRPDGEDRWVRSTFVAIRGDVGVTGIHGIGRDITETVVRREQMSLLYSALDSLDQAVAITELETSQPLYRNKAWARLLGVDPERVMDVSISQLLPEGEADRSAEIGAGLRDAGQWTGRIWRRRLDDGRVIALDTMHGTASETAGRTMVFSIMQDASIEIERERMMRRAERLASLGTLVGGVAHELNNPLHAIRTFAELLLDGERSEEDRTMLEMTRREADRAARVVADLRLFARRTQDDSLTRGAVDLNEVVRHAVNVRSYTLSTRNIEVVTELGDIPHIYADGREIEQLVFNLFINAEQALVEGSSDGRSAIRLRTSVRDGMAELEVIDNGAGISEKDLEMIFDPFFTTKAPGQGTGLGLSLAHRIVQEHMGEIRAESAVARGTTFTVRLPLAPESDAPAEPPAAANAESSRPLRILVVDDEPAIRKVVGAYLKRRGHIVDTASDGGEALELISSSNYDVLISDLRMPGVDGAGLLANLRERSHALADRAFFLTGDPPEDPSIYAVPVLAKPVRMEMVANLAEKLGGVSPSNGH